MVQEFIDELKEDIRAFLEINQPDAETPNVTKHLAQEILEFLRSSNEVDCKEFTQALAELAKENLLTISENALVMQ